jgi:hypothetical protein
MLEAARVSRFGPIAVNANTFTFGVLMPMFPCTYPIFTML